MHDSGACRREEANPCLQLVLKMESDAAQLAATARQAEAAKQRRLVPLAGIEPALLAELDFESSASTNSATGACRDRPDG
jgi:hypothetical protein